VDYFGWTALEERDRCERGIGTGCVGVQWTELQGSKFRYFAVGVVTKCKVVQYKDRECLDRVLPTAHGERRAVDIIIVVNHLYAGYLQLQTLKAMFLGCILLQ